MCRALNHPKHWFFSVGCPLPMEPSERPRVGNFEGPQYTRTASAPCVLHIWVMCSAERNVYFSLLLCCGRVIECQTFDCNVTGSNLTRGQCVPTPTQRAIPPGSVNEYQGKLGSKQAYYAIRWPRIRDLAASTGVRLRATGNGDHCRTIGPRGSEELYFLHCACSV